MSRAGSLVACCFTIVLAHPVAVSAQESAVAAGPTQTKPVGAGTMVPDATVVDLQGQAMAIRKIANGKPLVLVFFRGGWCPICTRHTQELIKIHPQVKELGAELMGISPDSVDSSNENVSKNSIPFPIYSDADISASKAFGLAFQVDDETINRYKGFGIDLEKASGHNHHALPIPAVYILDGSGKIVFAHSNPDYQERLDAATIISELKKLAAR